MGTCCAQDTPIYSARAVRFSGGAADAYNCCDVLPQPPEYGPDHPGVRYISNSPDRAKLEAHWRALAAELDARGPRVLRWDAPAQPMEQKAVPQLFELSEPVLCVGGHVKVGACFRCQILVSIRRPAVQ